MRIDCFVSFFFWNVFEEVCKCEGKVVGNCLFCLIIVFFSKILSFKFCTSGGGGGGVNVNENMESNFFFKYFLNYEGNVVWKEIYNFGFEDKFYFEVNILEWLKVYFLYD